LQYPNPTQVANFKQTIASNLQKKIPMGVEFRCIGSGVCPIGMTDGHGVVIKGMRKNPASGKCELLIHNSWGKTWQNDHNGGWVEATPLIEKSYEYAWID
jgi:hypothetical protein